MIQIQDFVKAGLFQNEEDTIQTALRYLLRARADLRIRMAIYQYTTDSISLARAAYLAGVSWAQMLDILRENGVQPFLGPETVAEAEEEAASLRRYLGEQTA